MFAMEERQSMNRQWTIALVLGWVWAGGLFASADDKARRACDQACSDKLRMENDACWQAQRDRFRQNPADTGDAYRECMRKASDASLMCFEKCLGIDTPRSAR